MITFDLIAGTVLNQHKEEDEIASNNLPNNFFLSMDTQYKDDLHSASHLWLFPYSKKAYCEERDYFSYFSDTLYAKLMKQTKQFLFEETVSVDLNEIPLIYDFIDIYSIGYADYKLSIDISFSISNNNNKKYLFGYRKHLSNYNSFFQKGICSNILIGTLGKVSDGWKFYPIFRETDMDRKEIIKQYISGV